ncbi:hypothetical protein RB597_007855 [Gaeumannomyces tritici]
MYLTDGPMPTPGENEVLVEIHAVSINYRDTEVANGIYKSHHKSLAESTPSPITPCSDMCGVVVAVGPTPSPTWQVGDRVVSTFIPGFASGQVPEPQLATSLGFSADGVPQTHRVFPSAGLVGGLVSCIGYLSGTHEKAASEDAAAPRPHVNLLALTRNSTIKGILNGPQDGFVEMNAFLAGKGVKPLVEWVFSLEEGKEAMQYLASGSHFGKVVLRVKA